MVTIDKACQRGSSMRISSRSCLDQRMMEKGLDAEHNLAADWYVFTNTDERNAGVLKSKGSLASIFCLNFS